MWRLRAPSLARTCPRFKPKTLPRISHGRRGLATSQSSSQASDSADPPSRASLYAALTIGVIGSLAYSLRNVYGNLFIWPDADLRDELRNAIKARRVDDYRTSAIWFSRALKRARESEPHVLGEKRTLKISGIAIALGAMLEAIPDQVAAYAVYATAHSELASPPSGQSVESSWLRIEERMRAVQLKVRMADLANAMADLRREEECLTWATEEVLRLARGLREKGEETSGQVGPKGKEREREGEDKDVLGVLELPAWMDKVDLTGVLERAAEFYTRQGNIEYAVPLYLTAISILVPPPADGSTRTPIVDQCRAAVLMNDLANMFAKSHRTKQANIPQARAWAAKALAVVEKARAEEGQGATSECETVFVSSLFNLGVLNEMSSSPADRDKARGFYKRALAEAKVAGYKEGVAEARAALRRLDGA